MMQISLIILKCSMFVEDLLIYRVSSLTDEKEAISRQVCLLPLHPTGRQDLFRKIIAETRQSLMMGPACSSLGKSLTCLSPWP